VAEPAHDGNDTRLGRLRTYLGTAPGVGKTYAMLNHGWRRSEGGERVVVGWIERHGRAETQAQLRNLEVVPRRSVDYRGSRFDELDVAAIMARQPDVVLIDELAHTHVDGTRKRWEDAAELLAAGLSVMTTVNVANLVSARDYAARVTGVGTVESVPDEFVRSGEVVLIDPPPEAIRRRIAAGNVYTADTVGGEDDADLLVVHVNVADGLGRRGAKALDRYRDMAIDAGGHYVEVDGTNLADSLAAVARERHATRIVVARHRSRLNELVRGSVASRMRRLVRETPVDEVHGRR
jgi:K+-sensing histidine kinase KdpD